MTVHAGLPAYRDLLGEGLSGHRHDGDPATWRRRRTNPARRLQPVHARHSHIHQDRVEIPSRSRRDRRVPAIDGDHLVSGAGQENTRDIAVHGFVVDNKDV